MENKIVYVITSEGNDFYSIMTRVSIASIRISNPSLKIVLFCDHISYEKLLRKKDSILEEVDDTISIVIEDERPEFRNRFIKTKLRNLIQGKFIFIDSDVLVKENISELFELQCDIAAAMNHSEVVISKATSKSDRETFEIMNWDLPSKVYYNGGFIFYNDTAKAKEFSDMWYSNWVLTSNNTGKYRDQPALNYSLMKYNGTTLLLAEIYNAQIKANIRAFKNAKVWHFYSSQEIATYFAFEQYINDVILKKVNFKLDNVSELIGRSHPFFADNYFTRKLAIRIQKENKLSQKSMDIFSKKRKLPF